MISLLLIPFLACIVLSIVHVYFGAFVLRRGILFIDLALAQWAALGYVVGQALGLHSHSALFASGFLFTIMAALILSLLKPIYDKVHLQEAVIGVIYIAGAALATGIISSTGLESHHLEEMLTGHLLFIQATDLISALILYTGIAAVIALFHQKFIENNSRIWDFIFYALFGAVVTSSVSMVGILLVFSFLVLPILSVTLFSQEIKQQVLWAWGIAILSSLAGLGISMAIDIPPSFCVILTLCTAWGLSTIKASIQGVPNAQS